ncbi:uncharacterized protein LOC107609348 isoform X5 [Arachis ipaensis]|uniref:uncharacterized protein LOC107609348 isoform X5 n=1 Tax=Arachis ipaensis TaxID=130454 RepID=UPI000A2B3E4A|nr:uncharacterized protein LOC107609348 isoform X5 [Arachis ipaensis]XP_025666200.1 uncharacterized protein LOC112764684 isoform X6 [Arachis hypogaea]
METKKITNMKDREDQIKMPTKNCNEENHLVKMKANEIEGQSGKKPSRKKVPMKKSKVEDNKTKMNTNDADGQSKKLTNKKMLMMKSNEEDANEEEHKIESLIPAMTLDEFFEKYGISLDENDKEYEYDYDDHNPSVGDSSDSQLGTKKKKVRGPTQLKHIHAMETQIELTWCNGRPIGPTKTQVQLFSRFLGTLARNSNLVTLLYTSWQAVSSETKTSMLDYAKRAKKEGNEDPSQSEMFVVTRTNKKGETDSGTQETIDHLQNLKQAGYSDDEALQTVFGKEKHGRVRFYGRSVTKSSLKKDKQIRQMQQQHAEVVSTMEKNQNNLTSKLDGLTSLIKMVLQQVNPGMSAEQVQVMIEAAQQSPPDASSAPNDARRSIPPSLGSNHVSKDMEQEDMM